MRLNRKQILLLHAINRSMIIKISPWRTSVNLQDFQDSRQKKQRAQTGKGEWISRKSHIAFLVKKFIGRRRRSAWTSESMNCVKAHARLLSRVISSPRGEKTNPALLFPFRTNSIPFCLFPHNCHTESPSPPVRVYIHLPWILLRFNEFIARRGYQFAINSALNRDNHGCVILLFSNCISDCISFWNNIRAESNKIYREPK